MPVIQTLLLLRQDSLRMSESALVVFFILHTWIVCLHKQHETVAVGHLLLQLQQKYHFVYSEMKLGSKGHPRGNTEVSGLTCCITGYRHKADPLIVKSSFIPSLFLQYPCSSTCWAFGTQCQQKWQGKIRAYARLPVCRCSHREPDMACVSV